MTEGFIRKSTEDDISIIRSWLKQQADNNVHGTFFCNWEVIHGCHRNNELVVFIDKENDMPIAFLIENFDISRLDLITGSSLK